MFKLIALVLGLVVGFGGGVWWGQKNPEAAGKLSAEEERRFLEAQVQITQKIQAKLDQLSSKTSSTPGGSGFVSNSQSGSGAPAADVKELKADTEKQEQELQQRIAKLK
ncbi:MAG TPA: hypothetical protein VF669_12995 [Tepidisphaeraceae bacterium]|jgi:hypothetical protein